VVLSAAVLAGCGEGKPAGPGAAIAKGTRFGFNEDVSVTSYSDQAKLGMPLRRFPVAWGDVEHSPGHWSWATFDGDYRAMRASGLVPLLVAVGAPCWAGSGETPCQGGSLRGPPSPSHDADWAAYVRRLVQRYPAAIGVEIWNEPNLLPNFEPRPDPVRYTALLKAAYAAVKSVDPKLPVISAGLIVGSGTGTYAISDADFLAGMYRAGAKGSMDGIGAHPYPISGGPGGPRYDLGAMRDDLARLRAVRNAAGDSGTPVWITETGVSTASAPGFPPGAGEDEQAHDLLEMVTAAGEGERIPVMLIHRLVDAPANPSAGALGLVESGFGVLRSDGSTKPAACELSQAFHGTLSC
jgi:hypothetical protein